MRIKIVLFCFSFLFCLSVIGQETTTSSDNVKAKLSFTLRGIKITDFQQDTAFSSDIKIPTSLAVKNYITGHSLNIFNSNGTLSSERTIDGNRKNLYYSNLAGLHFNSSSGSGSYNGTYLADQFGSETYYSSTGETSGLSLFNRTITISQGYFPLADTSYNSKIRLYKDSIWLYPWKGGLFVDSLLNKTTSNTLLGWKQGTGQGAVGYVTIGSNLSLSGGVLSATAGGTQTLNQTIGYGNKVTGSIIFDSVTAHPADGVGYTKNAITINALDTAEHAAAFKIGTSANGGASGVNHVMYMGWNLEPGGGKATNSLPSVGEGWEQRWRPGGGIDYTEKHEIWSPAGSTTTHRISSYTCDNTAGTVSLYHTINSFDLRKPSNGIPYYVITPGSLTIGNGIVSTSSRAIKMDYDTISGFQWTLTNPTGARDFIMTSGWTSATFPGMRIASNDVRLSGSGIFYPETDNAYQIGRIDVRWKEIWGVGIFGNNYYGTSASGGNLTLNSTSNGTKGLIKFGASSAYDEVNSRLGIGTTSPSYRLHVLEQANTANQANVAGVIFGTDGNGSTVNTSTNNMSIFMGKGIFITPAGMSINTSSGVISPLSILDAAGSFGMAITTTSTNITLDDTHHTVILISGTPVVTLPAASGGNARREYTIINQTGSSRTISSYLDYTGASVTTIPANSSTTIQSNGSNWYRTH